MKDKKWLWIAAGLLVLAWAIWFSPTRMVLLWLLPIGSGPDDFIQAAALIFGGILLAWYILRRRFLDK